MGDVGGARRTFLVAWAFRADSLRCSAVLVILAFRTAALRCSGVFDSLPFRVLALRCSGVFVDAAFREAALRPSNVRAEPMQRHGFPCRRLTVFGLILFLGPLFPHPHGQSGQVHSSHRRGAPLPTGRGCPHPTHGFHLSLSRGSVSSSMPARFCCASTISPSVTTSSDSSLRSRFARCATVILRACTASVAIVRRLSSEASSRTSGSAPRMASALISVGSAPSLISSFLSRVAPPA